MRLGRRREFNYELNDLMITKGRFLDFESPGG